MDCPKCQSNVFCKNGRAHSRQRYLCKKCNYHYTVSQRFGTGNLSTKRQALELYLEGLGFRSIGRILNFSNVTILKLENNSRKSKQSDQYGLWKSMKCIPT